MGKTDELPGIGTVRFRKIRRARRVSIHVKPFHGVLVTVPYRASFESARRIVLEHRAWIVKKLDDARRAESAVSLGLTDGAVVKTRQHTMRAVACEASEASWTIADGSLTIFYPQHMRFTDAPAQEALRAGLIAAYRAEAKQLLPARVRYWADHFGFTYSHVTIKNMRSRWGSCSGSNIINLNLHLMRLNDSLIDYVILHELVHTRIRNHGAGFWKHLQALVGNARQLDAQLRAQPIAFF
ncbi:MAG: M48 family metallopeptidase [Acidobacteriota bacterium]